jgi:hypothetical protein
MGCKMVIARKTFDDAKDIDAKLGILFDLGNAQQSEIYAIQKTLKNRKIVESCLAAIGGGFAFVIVSLGKIFFAGGGN